DVRVVMDAVDCERAAIFGASEGGNMSMIFAATYPERTIALCTFGCTAKRIWSPDYPWAPTREKRLETFAETERYWTTGLGWGEGVPSLGPAGAGGPPPLLPPLRQPRRGSCPTKDEPRCRREGHPADDSCSDYRHAPDG